MTNDEREHLHFIIQDCYALLDLDAHPELAKRIDAVLLPCDRAGTGKCVPYEPEHIPSGETPAQPERVEEPPLMAWMTAETSEQRDAAFLRMYAAKVLDRTAVTWEIPNTVATTLTDIANRIEQRSASLMGARVPHPETEETK